MKHLGPGVALFSLSAALIWAGVFWTQGHSHISGMVISSSTRAPISEAMVVVQSGASDGPNSPEPIYVKTDTNGRFKARLYDDNVSIRVWKPGYAENGTTNEDGPLGSEIVLELREMSATNWVPEHEGFYEFEISKGFSFALAKSVSATSSMADIVLSTSKEDPTKAFIEVAGQGGIVFQPFAKNVDFYNTPEAPESGYTNRLPIEMSRMGLYFLRSRDGRHYAKFRLMLSAVTSPKGSQYLDWDDTRMIWAYQSDGTRNLEIMRPQAIPYPFSQFALPAKPESSE